MLAQNTHDTAWARAAGSEQARLQILWVLRLAWAIQIYRAYWINVIPAVFAAAPSKVIVLEHPAADAVRSIIQSAKLAVPAL